MSLFAFVSNIWTAFSPRPPPPRKRDRRPRAFDPEIIEPINHWYPGGRNRKEPRRLVETPTANHYPEYRVAKSVVNKGRKRCAECGALIKELPQGVQVNPAPVRTVKRKSAMAKALDRREENMNIAKRSLRGRVVEYVG